MELREDGKYYYALEIERGTGERSLLYRTFDDFWALQVALLNHFPSESGRRPAAKQRKQHLVTYLSELIRLPPAIMESPHTRRFFQAKQPSVTKASNAAAVKAVTDVGGTLIDLIENYNGSGPAPQRYDNDYDPDVPYHEQGISPPLSSPNSPVDTSLRVKLAFRIPDALVPFEELLDEVEDRMRAVGALSPGGAGLSGLAYKDECGMLVPLCGDEDLSLLFRTCPLKLVFYPR
ncbi:hypothetical protein BC829DRAFT_391975 [Chytridium lagenaria]|nr:hypothetical protein BC829DRAFT_391975 [Chytridium lagenaria]